MFSGIYTALVTPFKEGSVDFSRLEELVDRQIAGGVDGLVPMGTTGESPTLSHEEHREVIRRVVAMVKGRVPVIAGSGSNSTEEAVSLSRKAESDGADGLLLVNPYYNRPTQPGLIAHFKKIADSVSIPCMLYNIPGRTGVNFLPENAAKLIEKCPNVVAMKEASGDIAQVMRLRELTGEGFSIFSGDDNLFLPVMAVGGNGVVSVLSNLIPADMKAIYTDFTAGNITGARERFYRILPLCRAMFIETNPIPVKAAMELCGYASGDVRLPLLPLGGENLELVKKNLIAYGLLKP